MVYLICFGNNATSKQWIIGKTINLVNSEFLYKLKSKTILKALLVNKLAQLNVGDWNWVDFALWRMLSMLNIQPKKRLTMAWGGYVCECVYQEDVAIISHWYHCYWSVTVTDTLYFQTVRAREQNFWESV